MISVLVLGFSTATGRSPTLGEMIRTLTALVPGTVEGIVRDVTLLATAPNADVTMVADHAGCALVQAQGFQAAIVAGARQARCDLLLVLPAGVTFDRALSDEIAAASEQDRAAHDRGLRLRSAESGVLGRFLPKAVPTVGLLVSRTRLLAATADSLPVLVRACRAQRSFKTRAWTGD